MGKELPHEKVKLVIPVLFTDLAFLEKAKKELLLSFGEMDFESEFFPFTFTDYYKSEMGSSILRIFYSFKDLIEIPDLVQIKKETNRIELELAIQDKRKMNLDPGYMELGKFVLATTKDQQHRLYMGEGIYEEITLYFRDKEWRSREWTYPDYQSPKYKEILMKIREIYKSQIRN